MKRSQLALFPILFLLAQVCGAQESPKDKFWKACRNGDLATVRELVDSGMDVNMELLAGMRPLSAAAFRGQAEVVQFLLERGANPDVRDDTFQLTPLGAAFFFGHQKVVGLLLPKTTLDLNIVLRFGAMMGAAPLVEAALKGKVQPRDLAIAWTLAKVGDKKDVLALLEKSGATAPPAVSAAELARFTGSYQDASKLEVIIEVRDGKLLATGGSGFSEFFEEEALPAGKDLLFLKTNPGTLMQFSGAGEKFPQVTLIIGGSAVELRRLPGGTK